MSMELMVLAMQTPVGNPLRKLVLLKLADNASDTGECWPSYKHIAEQCEIAKSTVREHIRALVENGLVSIEHRTGPQGYKSNIYHLHLCRQAAYPMPTGGIPYADNQHTLCRLPALEPVIEPVKKEIPPPPPPSDQELAEVEEYIRLEPDRAERAGEIRTSKTKYAAGIRKQIAREGGKLTPERQRELEVLRTPPTPVRSDPVITAEENRNESQDLPENSAPQETTPPRIQRIPSGLPPWEQEILRTREYIEKLSEA